MSGIEREIKLRISDPLLWESIENTRLIREIAVPGTFRVERQEARYYDTRDLDLNKAGLNYRVRRENGRPVATVKERGTYSAGGFSARMEWSVELDGGGLDGSGPDITCFRDLPVWPKIEAALRGKPELQELFASRFERKVLILDIAGTVELAADKGEMVADGRILPICELELEIIDTDFKAVMIFADALSAEYSLIPENRSKFERGMELAGLKGT